MGQPTVDTPDVDRRHTDQGLERKQQLLETAEVLFAEAGYAQTRIADICAAAGVAKGLFYWYFPTKQSLFAELVRTMRQQLRRAQAAAMDPRADALTRIRQGSMASLRFMAEHRAYFTLLDVERSEPTLAEVLRDGSDVYAADVVRLIIEAQADGTVAPGDPQLHAVGRARSGLLVQPRAAQRRRRCRCRHARRGRRRLGGRRPHRPLTAQAAGQRRRP